MFADEFLKLDADFRTLGFPEHQTLAHLVIDRIQTQLRAKHAMIALLGFFKAIDMFVELLLVEEGRAVDAGELLAFAVTAPVGPGDALQFEGLDPPRCWDVRAAAQVGEIALAVDADRLFAGRA